QIIEDAVGDGFVKSALVAVRPYVQLQALQFHAQAIGDVVEHEGREVGLTGARAQASKFRYFHVNPVVARERGIDECFRLARRLGWRFGWHSCARATKMSFPW